MDESTTMRFYVEIRVNDSLSHEINAEITARGDTIDQAKVIRDVEDAIFYFLKKMAYDTRGEVWFSSFPLTDEQKGQS